VLALANLGIVGYVQPYARYAYEGLRFELRSGALGASIKVGEFAKLGKRMTLRVEESRDGGRDLRGIFVNATDKGGKSLAVTAEGGEFLATDDPDVIILRLSNGTLVHNMPDYKEPRVLSFEAHDLPIDLPKIEAFRMRGGRDLELTIPELVRTGGDLQAPEDFRRASIANFNHRLVQVAAMFALPLLALALAVPPKRSTSALGVFLSIVIIVTYHKINEYTEQMGALGRINPWIALWVPYVFFCAFCYWMFQTLSKPGGQPIGALERGFAKLSERVVKMLRRQRLFPADL
jgi:lipopolysaccharide export system permease protein